MSSSSSSASTSTSSFSFSTLLLAPLLFVVAIPYTCLHVVVQSAAQLLHLPRFIYRWFLHPSTHLESRYHPQEAYALITGASDGLGRAFAHELAGRKWNLILHGRNPSKLDAIVTTLKNAHPELDIRAVIADCTQPQELPAILAHNLRDMRGPLTLVINNAGFLHSLRPFQNLRQEEIGTTMATNVVFPTMLAWLLLRAPQSSVEGATESTSLLAATNGWDETALLPRLGQTFPGVLINVSSMASVLPLPLDSVYGASKAFLTKFSLDLQNDLPSDVEVLNLIVGPIRTPMWRGKSSFLVPTAETSAKKALSAVGLGRKYGGAWVGYDMLDLGAVTWNGDGVWLFWVIQVSLGFAKVFPPAIGGIIAGVVSKWMGWVEPA